MGKQLTPSLQPYEVRLAGAGVNALIFVTVKETEQQASDYAYDLLERHSKYDHAELWSGMQLLRQI